VTLFRLALASAVAVLVVLGVIVGRPVARGVVIVGILSVLLAYVVGPPAERLRRVLRLGRRRQPLSLAAAILVIYALAFALVIGAWYGVRPLAARQLDALETTLPTRLDALKGRLRGLEARATRFVETDPLRHYVASVTRAASTSVEAHALEVAEEISGSRALVPWLLLVPVNAWLLVTKWDAFRRSAVARLPTGHLRWQGDEFFGRVNRLLAAFTRAQLWSCAIMAGLCTFGFWLIGVPYALAVGLLAGVLEFVPVVGPLVAATVACALVDGERLLVLVAFLVGLRLVQDYTIYPRLVGRGMHLNAFAVIGAIWTGAAMGGAAGVLTAIPVLGIATVALRQYRDYRDIEALVKEHEATHQETEPPG